MIDKSELLEMIEGRIEWLTDLCKCHLNNNNITNYDQCKSALEELEIIIFEIKTRW